MAREEHPLFRDIYRALHIVIMWLFIVVAASLLGVDSCTCGYGKQVRKQVNQLIHCDHKHHNNNKKE